MGNENKPWLKNKPLAMPPPEDDGESTPPKKQTMPVSHGPAPMQPDEAPTKVKTDSLTQWMFTISNQLSELTNLIRELNPVIITKRQTPEELAAKPEFPTLTKTKERVESELRATVKNNLPKKSATGTVIPPIVKDVPSMDVLAHAMGKYITKHGRGALETRLAQYKVKKAGELSDENKILFLQDIT